MSLEQSDREAAAVAKAERVTLDSIKAKVAKSEYILNGVMTICIVHMANGYTVLGKSAPAAVENFNADLGKKFAYEDAIRQIWPLEGYLLREKLALANR